MTEVWRGQAGRPPSRGLRAWLRHPLRDAYRQATTVTWLGIVACQAGRVFAVRNDHASLRQVGVFSNKLLLGATAVALAFAAALVCLPMMHGLFGTACFPPPSSPS